MPETTDEIDAFHKKCREAGYRVTPQRTRIFREVQTAEGHPDAETVYKRVRGEFPAISRDTVYRTLHMLEDLELVSRVSVLSERARFDPRTDQHHHFICTECNAIYDFDSPEADRLELPDTVRAFGRVDALRMEVHGICRDCCDGDEQS